MDQTTPILQASLAVKPWLVPGLWRLPGLQPLEPARWLQVDDAYGAQLAEKARLVAVRLPDVHALPDAARPAAVELMALVLAHLARRPGFAVQGDRVTRPDGATVRIDPSAPLLTLGQLVQEDFCLLQKAEVQGAGDEHRLTAALLGFPGSWTLAQKLGRPLSAIHQPVASYDDQMARRVQRLFDLIRPDQPLFRINALLYADATLFQPKGEAEVRPRQGARAYLRAERQSLWRLPETGAVVFSIHTSVVAAASLTDEDHAALALGGH